MLHHIQYPHTRLRRTRMQEWSRDLVAETNLSADHLILPVFVIDEKNRSVPVDSMPGVSRHSPDLLLKEAEKALEKGVRSMLLFPALESSVKTADAALAYDPDNLICRTIRLLKKELPEMGIFADVALDYYTDHGHDGIFDGKEVLNDATVSVLIQQSLAFAEAGADSVAPSDMMDGRIAHIREALEKNKFHNVLITSYAAKYASAFYGPFRDGVKSGSCLGKKNKKTYQMDPRNGLEALKEAHQDIEEGADFLIVKPGLPYLDVIARIKDSCNIPLFAYHVSGEYAMLKAAAQTGWMDSDRTLYETLISFRRAGCAGVFTYAALEAADLLKSL